ncbi:MAG: cysteine desulfurase family protein [Thermoanaerobaculia bacterium]|nr:cysteine desulfurase family protein [Thermoanaerobaculia bacterium]
MPPVYLDHNATTPLDPRVRDAMLPWLGERFGNPSSRHAFGQAAREAVEEARARVAGLVGVRPPQIVFCASGTEANNAVIEGCAGRERGAGGHLVISALEHPSVTAAADRLERLGVEVTRVAPGREGVIDAEEMVVAVRPGTRLVCLMLAHNELGTVQPVREVAAGCRERGVPILVDAVQAPGKIAVDAGELGADFLVIGAHKFHGPLGAAALAVRAGAELPPLLVGGGQERRRRAGTENVPALVGMGVAAALAATELEERRRHLAALRGRFETGLAEIGGAVVHGAAAERLPNTTHVGFPGVDAEALMIRLDLDGYAVSMGSACSSGAAEKSGVLLAMGASAEEAAGSIRVSFGMANHESEVDGFLDALSGHLAELAPRAAAS